MPIEDVILRLLKFKYWLIGILLFTFSLSFYILNFKSVKQRAEVVFMLNDIQITDVGLTEKDIATSAQASALTTERFYKFLFSDELIKNIDKKLQLGKHFGHHPSEEFYFWKVSNDYIESLHVNKNGFNFITMVVEDRDAGYAAELADAIIEELKRMQTFYIKQEILQRTEVYDQVLKNIHSDYVQSIDSLNESLFIIKNSGYSSLPEESKLQLKLSITNFTHRLEDVADRFNYISKAYLVSNQTSDKEIANTVYVINKKYFRNPTTSTYVHIMISLFIAFLLFLVVMVVGYIYYANLKVINLLLKRKPPEQLD